MNITYYTNNNYINTIYCLPILPTLPHNPKNIKTMNEEDLKKFTTWFCSRFDTMQTDMAMVAVSLAGHPHTTEKVAVAIIKRYADRKGKALILTGEKGEVLTLNKK